MGLKLCQSETLLCSSVFFLGVQTTDCAVPVKMLLSLRESLQLLFQALTSPSASEHVSLVPAWGVWRRICWTLLRDAGSASTGIVCTCTYLAVEVENTLNNKLYDSSAGCILEKIV